MKAVRIPLFVLAVLLAFSVCSAVYLTRRCHAWQAEVMAADRAAAVRGEAGMLPHDLFAPLGQLFAENRR